MNDESDEDPSDEEKRSDEHEDSQEPGSEGENDDNDYNSDDTNDQQDNDQKAKKKKSIDKLSYNYRKNKKSIRSGRRRSGNSIIKKRKESYTEKKQRLKTGAIMTKVDSKRSVRRDKLNGRKRTKKTFDTVHVSTTPRFSTEQTTNDDYERMIRQQYADYISKVAHAIAKERGMEVSERYIDKDIEDLIEFQLKLTEVNV